MFLTFHAIISEDRNLSLKCWFENRVWHEIATILQSVTSRQRIVYRHNTAGLISKVSEEVAIIFAGNCRRRQLHRRLTPLPR